MKIARLLLVGHLTALAFGLAGLLIALPHPQWWAHDPHAIRVYRFGMEHGGATHILFGAAAVFAFAWYNLGRRRTLIFFVAATSLSLSSELIGTGTGWPFGNYSYTTFLGTKILGRVPYTIPLSWFYMGLTSYLLGSILAARFARRRTLWSLGLGVWFLTAWDLVLDPAMADKALQVQFWVWHQTGAYFGMPIQNLIGWSLTGLLYMTVARLLWRRNLDLTRDLGRRVVWFPLTVYVANIGFAMVLSASVGLWLPIALAALIGLGPAVLVWRIGRTRRVPPLPEPSWHPLPNR